MEPEEDNFQEEQRFPRCMNCGVMLNDDLDTPYKFCPHCAEEAQDVNQIIPFEEWKPF